MLSWRRIKMTKYATVIGAAVVAFVAGLSVDRAVVSAQAKNRVFELRIYTAPEGRLQPLLARFRDHSVALLKKHGMPTVGFWVAADAPQSANTLVYILAHPNREEADKSWKVFNDDPEWKTVVEESQRDGRLVTKVDRMFMSPTDFSPIK
jgi:NIPSNAP